MNLYLHMQLQIVNLRRRLPLESVIHGCFLHTPLLLNVPYLPHVCRPTNAAHSSQRRILVVNSIAIVVSVESSPSTPMPSGFLLYNTYEIFNFDVVFGPQRAARRAVVRHRVDKATTKLPSLSRSARSGVSFNIVYKYFTSMTVSEIVFCLHYTVVPTTGIY